MEIGNEASDFLSPSLPALIQIEHTSGGTSRNAQHRKYKQSEDGVS
jgi:hypothetical protein